MDAEGLSQTVDRAQLKQTKEANPETWLQRVLAKGPGRYSGVKRNAAKAGLLWISFSDSEPSVVASLKAIGGLEVFGRLDGKGKPAHWLLLTKDVGRITKPPPRESRAAAMATLEARRQELEKEAQEREPQESVSRPDTRLPNTTPAKRYSAKPLPEELANPYRTIRNSKMLIQEYQRENLLYAATIEYLNKELAAIDQTETVNAAVSPANTTRSAARRMLRRIRKTTRELQALRAGKRQGGRTTGDMKIAEGEITKRRVLAEYRKLIESRRPAREITAVISQRINRSQSQVSRILRAHKKTRTS